MNQYNENIIVLNKGKIPIRGSNIHGEIVRLFPPVPEMISFDAFDPRVVKYSPQTEVILENISIPKEQIDPKIIQAERRISQYFSLSAQVDGYVENMDDVSWRFVYVDHKKMIDLLGNWEDINHIGGFTSTSTNTIYIGIPTHNNRELMPLEIYNIQSNMIHESSHRIKKKIWWIQIDNCYHDSTHDTSHAITANKRVSNAIERLSPYIKNNDLMQGFALEELFAVGNTMELAPMLIDKEIQPIVERIAQENNIDMRYISGFYLDEQQKPHFVYASYMQIFLLLQSRVNDILSLIDDVRRNVPRSRNIFARRITKEFGPDVFKGLLYATNKVKDRINLLNLIQIADGDMDSGVLSQEKREYYLNQLLKTK